SSNSKCRQHFRSTQAESNYRSHLFLVLPNKSLGLDQMLRPPPQIKSTPLPSSPVMASATEVTPVAVEALRLAGSLEGIDFEFKEMLVGGAAYEATGVPFPEETLKASLESDAVYLGAAVVGSSTEASRPEVGLMRIRRALGSIWLISDPSPSFLSFLLKRSVTEEVDFMIIRELAGGLYYGKPRGFGINEKGEDTGFCTEIYSSSEVDVSLELHLTCNGTTWQSCSVDKATILELICSHIASGHIWHGADSVPQTFDVLLTTNVFGDILSDVSAMITAALECFPPPASEPRDRSSSNLFTVQLLTSRESNPLAAVLTAVMLLRRSGRKKRIENAIFDTLNEGFRTQNVGCKKMGEEILKSLYVRVPSYQLN
ncbi:hypothetical protein HID58_091547, partial [Brassica napus]